MRFGITLGVALAIVVALPAAPAVTPASSSPAPAVAAPVALPRHSAVVTAAKLAADYYRTTYAHTTLTPRNGWSWSTYTQGVQALYRQAGDARYLADGMAWGRSNSWGLGTTETNPDTVKAGQTYFDLHAVDPSASLTAMDARMSGDLTTLPVSQYDWIDALFMGLPDWIRWAARTGNPAYLAKLDALYAWTRDQGATSTRCAGKAVTQPGLFDSAQGLWYRDCSYVGAKDANGRPVFWARGNGWVMAALADVLASLPATDQRRAKYASMLQTMAARLRQLQGSDGMWRASLVDPALYPRPETSGTGLITYALAYGIKAGVLDSATYLPVVALAWHGLTTLALQPSGFVTDCQGPGVSPGAAYSATAPRTAPTATSAGTVNVDSPPFCVGAVLLAGAAIARLTASVSTGRPVAYTAQQVGNEAARVDDGDVTTRWSANGFPQAVTVDLGTTRQVSNAMVVPYLDRPYRYRIQTSTDDAHWQLVVDRSTNTAGGSRLDDFTTGPVMARYARLTVTSVYGAGTTWVSIQEFAVY
jgi:rhamnogalacturonyl hydrolase YesR